MDRRVAPLKVEELRRPGMSVAPIGNTHGVSTRIAFLRAVNVGKRRVPMSRVVDVCEGLGSRDVWTHANSGNVVDRDDVATQSGRLSS